jgi:iron complex outermembrane receptor protein
MTIRTTFFYFVLQVSFLASAQTPDTTVVLDEVVLKAFSFHKPSGQVPAAVGIVDQKTMVRFAPVSLVSSVNTVAGVRMEERSPGSYRLAIRGSSLRAPFGIRNVKVYWNQLPLTDASGNTYLNVLDMHAVGSMEIIKGPGSSVYGAGIGGVVLLHGKQPRPDVHIDLDMMGASYGTSSYALQAQTVHHVFQANHLESEGYRDYSRMVRDMFLWQTSFEISKNQQLESSVFYSDLFYQTPGALTKEEWKDDPRQARPGTDQRNPHVHSKSMWLGVSHTIDWTDRLQTVQGVYGNFVQFENSSFRNYERRSELGGGVRTVTRYILATDQVRWEINGGGELQFGFIPAKVYDNAVRNDLVLQQDDELNTTTYTVFLQTDIGFANDIHVTAGASVNQLHYHFARFSDTPETERKQWYTPQIMPRITVRKQFTHGMVYASVAKGFSPPSYAEVYPSEGTFNKRLSAEAGINVEAGAKWQLIKQRLNLEVTGYQLTVDDAIVLRRTVDDAEYFVNAGGTVQRGVEMMSNYALTSGQSDWNFWLSYTWQHYRFDDYVQDQTDLSDNELTGVPSRLMAGGVDYTFRDQLSLSVTMGYTDRIPLNNENSVYADAYTLVGAKLQYKLRSYAFYAGSENLLDEKYSLGNDLNSSLGRYYNATPARSFFGGIKITLYRAQKSN